MSNDDDRLDSEAISQLMREVRDLSRALEGTATSWIRVRGGGFEVEVERAGGIITASQAAPFAVSAGLGAPGPAAGMMPVVAPLVGVFYRAASPGADPFVSVGDSVERGQTLCIIEAMKVMNEVTSDFRGTVAEILVENGEAVQYEQPLLLIDVGGA